MALAAICLLDGKGVVMELLQGEVEEAQIAAILKGKQRSEDRSHGEHR